MDIATIAVSGMSCGGCTGKVEKALSGIEGVSDASASLADANVVVTYDPAITSVEDMKKAIVEVGFEVG